MNGLKYLVISFVLCFAISSSTFAAVVSKSIGAQSIWSDALTPNNSFHSGYMNISISGTWVGTITLQRSFDSGSTWYDVETWTSNTQQSLTEGERGVQYKIGIDTGDYTSGTANVRLATD